MHQFLKFIFGKKSTCFGQFLSPSSGVFHCTHSNGICHTGFPDSCERDPARSCQQNLYDIYHCCVNLYDIYHCCVHSEKLLMMDRGTVRNM